MQVAQPEAARDDETHTEGGSADAEVQTMAAEAKALGYKLVPAGLEKEAKQLGYDLVPGNSAAGSPQGGDGEQTSEAMMRAGRAAKLQQLAEADVERRISKERKSEDYKRLQAQAALEKRLKLEFRAKHDMKKAQLREQALRKRASERRAAAKAVDRYSNLLSFPDEERKNDLKLLKESQSQEQRKDEAVAAARERARDDAKEQLSHYNLLTFSEDEFGSGTPAHAQESTRQRSSLKVAAASAKTGGEMPTALAKATQELAAARAQLAVDTLKLAAKPAAAGARSLVAARSGVARGVHAHQGGAHVRAGSGASHRGVEEREAEEREVAVHGHPKLEWDGKGIPRF